MSKFLTAPQWYDAGGGLNESLDVNCYGFDTATAFGKGAKAGQEGTAIGWGSYSPAGGVSVGYQASSAGGVGSVAIGKDAKANNAGTCIAIGEGAACVQTSKPSRKIQFFNRAISLMTVSEIGFGEDSLLDLIYPVGAIYISTASINPRDIFGGTWEAFAAGKTLVGVDVNDTDFNAANKAGGEKTVTLTTDQIPAHSHTFTRKGEGTQTAERPVPDSIKNTPYVHQATSDTGGGQSHNNMPPYITVYMWKRTA